MSGEGIKLYAGDTGNIEIAREAGTVAFQRPPQKKKIYKYAIDESRKKIKAPDKPSRYRKERYDDANLLKLADNYTSIRDMYKKNRELHDELERRNLFEEFKRIKTRARSHGF